MNYQDIKTLKGQVEYCLRAYPETRNSDITLTIQIWREFYPERMRKLGERMAVELKDLYDLPREDNVKRARAYFQNDKKLYLPTELSIAKRRGILEDEWRVAMGYPTKATTDTPAPSWTPPSEKKHQAHCRATLGYVCSCIKKNIIVEQNTLL